MDADFHHFDVTCLVPLSALRVIATLPEPVASGALLYLFANMVLLKQFIVNSGGC